jgi:16S rRNA (cytidine1402-2'-O)-methyltransferase
LTQWDDVCAELKTTLIYFVSPHALVSTLEDACAVFGGERRCCLARELTKLHEEFFRSSLQEALDEFTARAPRGEFTLVLEGFTGEAATATDAQIVEALRGSVAAGQAPSAAAKTVAAELGAAKRRVYQLSLQLE